MYGCFYLTFFGEDRFSWQPFKDKVAIEKLHFISREQSAEFFFSRKVCQMKGSQKKI
jgi:hypothetical protein